MFLGKRSVTMVDSSRAQFDESVRREELETLAGDANVEVLQCVRPVPERVWRMLDDVFFSRRPDVELRVWGHHAVECDLSFARHMGNVRRFAADSLMHAQNVEAIAELEELVSLSLGIFELRDFRVLELLAPTLTQLQLGATRSKKLALQPLSRFPRLKVLYLEGHAKNIGVLAELPALEDVTLRSITTPDLEFLRPHQHLWSLDIKLGGIRSFRGIEGKASLKYLELWQIRALRDVGIISELPELQNLLLQSLPHIASVPSISSARALRRVVLQAMKGLHDFSALKDAPALDEFALLDGAHQLPEQLIPVLENPHLRRAGAWFGSVAKNEAFTRLRESHGKGEFTSEPFEYRPS